MTEPPAAPPLAPDPQTEADAPRSGRSRALDSVIEIATTVALAVILYFVIQTFVVQTFRVEMVSMLDTLEPGDHMLIDKLTPRFDDYSRGDIVVFHPPADYDEGTPYIKRVIGEPGDTIAIKDGAVYVNGVRLDEPYVHYPIEADAWDQITVPAGELIVMGDHRDASSDSRAFGPIPISDVIGRAVLRFWPLDKLGIVQTPSYPGVPDSPEASPAP